MNGYTRLLFAAGAMVAAPSIACAQNCEPWGLVTATASNQHRHWMAFDTARSRAVLYGGWDFPFTGSVWEWDSVGWTEFSVAGPPQRYDHRMVYDAARGHTVLFGGRMATGTGVFLNETWAWNGTAWALLTTTGPAPRSNPGMAYDSARSRVVLFGGSNYPQGNTYFSDTWEWDGSAWVQRPVAGPTGRTGPAMAYDPVRQVVVLFGGGYFAPSWTLLGDTWEWDGAVWHQRATAGPPKRSHSAMIYDAGLGRIVMFGGEGGVYLGDWWQWNGAAWTTLNMYAGPAPQSYHAMVYDSARGAPVLYGQNSAGTPQTWAVRCAPCYPDCNSDSQLTVADFGCFQTKFVAGDPYADCNGDGQRTVADFGCFQTKFVVGCP